jgi:hemoglobin
LRERAFPAPIRDLDDPGEVTEMVRRFYSDVAQDDLLGPIFNTVVRVDWSEHLPKLTEYWCRLLLGQAGYSGNPLRAHLLVHQKSPFTDQHFERWLDLFCETVDLGWTGPNAEQAKTFAVRVARAHGRQLH